MTEADFSSYRTVKEIADGYIAINPVYLKKFSPGTLRVIHRELHKKMISVRAERTDFADIKQVRDRNLKMSRINNAIRMIQAYCKERKIPL